jgi:hypothetical protein
MSDQQTALAPFDTRAWRFVPQEFAQSIIPAPGLIALVLLPVNQLHPLSKPIASWQLPVVARGSTLEPRMTLRFEAPTKVEPALHPIAVLKHPKVLPAKEPVPTAVLPVAAVVPIKALAPTAVFERPDTLAVRALVPKAELADPESLLTRDKAPTAVLDPPLLRERPEL